MVLLYCVVLVFVLVVVGCLVIGFVFDCINVWCRCKLVVKMGICGWIEWIGYRVYEVVGCNVGYGFFVQVEIRVWQEIIFCQFIIVSFIVLGVDIFDFYGVIVELFGCYIFYLYCIVWVVGGDYILEKFYGVFFYLEFLLGIICIGVVVINYCNIGNIGVSVGFQFKIVGIVVQFQGVGNVVEVDWNDSCCNGSLEDQELIFVLLFVFCLKFVGFVVSYYDIFDICFVVFEMDVVVEVVLYLQVVDLCVGVYFIELNVIGIIFVCIFNLYIVQGIGVFVQVIVFVGEVIFKDYCCLISGGIVVDKYVVLIILCCGVVQYVLISENNWVVFSVFGNDLVILCNCQVGIFCIIEGMYEDGCVGFNCEDIVVFYGYQFVDKIGELCFQFQVVVDVIGNDFYFGICNGFVGNIEGWADYYFKGKGCCSSFKLISQFQSKVQCCIIWEFFYEIVKVILKDQVVCWKVDIVIGFFVFQYL